MHGWCGQALEVDLASGKSTVFELSQTVLEQTLGGRGLAGHLLRTRSSDLTSPVVCLACGPLCNSGVATADRLVAVFRSPLTSGVFDCSAGCSFAASLKGAGFDALVIKGAARELSQLWIDCRGARLLPATELAGLDTAATLARAKEGAAALAIGPAGENEVRFASVIASQGEPLARGGAGGLFGRMKLKLLSAEGRGETAIEEVEKFASAQADIQRLYNASPYLRGPLGIGACGTAALLDLTQARLMLPTDGFRRTRWDAVTDINAARLKKRPGYADNACPGCDIACRKRDGAGPLPEYDSLAHFGALLDIRDLEQILAAERCCQNLGLDPVSAAVVLGVQATLDKSRIDGAALPELLESMAHRSGVGDELAEGSLRYAARRDMPQAALCVKGLELPGFDPRGACGMALAMAVSPGGEYRHAQLHFLELLRKPVPAERFSFAGKARTVVQFEDATAAGDSLCVCRHTLIAAGLEEHAALLSAVTGLAFDAAALATVGRRTLLRERWLNQQFGLAAVDDALPELFFTEPGSRMANLQISTLDRNAFDIERSRYYRLRGLDAQGHPFSAPKEPA